MKNKFCLLLSNLIASIDDQAPKISGKPGKIAPNERDRAFEADEDRLAARLLRDVQRLPHLCDSQGGSLFRLLASQSFR
jgi:hypothetical protein